MHAKDIVRGKDKQWALGQKSDANATGRPASNIFLTGGFLNFNIKWVVGNTTPTTYFYAIALIPSSDSFWYIKLITNSKWEMAIEFKSAPKVADSRWFNSSPWKEGINPIY